MLTRILRIDPKCLIFDTSTTQRLCRQERTLLDSEAATRQLVRLGVQEGQLETHQTWREDLVLDPNDLHQFLLLQHGS